MSDHDTPEFDTPSDVESPLDEGPYLGNPEEVRRLVIQARKEFAIFLAFIALALGLRWGADHWTTGRRFFRESQVRRSGSDLFVDNVPVSAAGLGPLYVAEGQDPISVVDRYPVTRLADIVRAHLTLTNKFSGQYRDACRPNTDFGLTDTFQAQPGCIIVELTDLASAAYRLRLIDFERSDTRVFKALRDRFHIPPPKGSAVVRIFDQDHPLLPALDTFHRGSPEVAGACFNGRFIAIFGVNDNVEDVISHELVHAYVESASGAHSNVFPNWFHEGLALNINSAPVQTVEGTSQDMRIIMLTAQYREYKYVFDRIERVLGTERYDSVVAACIRSRSLAPLYESTGANDYASLRSFADRRRPGDLKPYALALGVGALLGALNFLRRRRKRAVILDIE